DVEVDVLAQRRAGLERGAAAASGGDFRIARMNVGFHGMVLSEVAPPPDPVSGTAPGNASVGTGARKNRPRIITKFVQLASAAVAAPVKRPLLDCAASPFAHLPF